jgi:hypothetical protein
MDAILKWVTEQSNLAGSFQVIIDMVLVVILIAVMFFQNRTPRSVAGTEDFTRSLGKIIEETKAIADEFEANLRERQALIQQLMSKLDQRVKDAQDLCNQLKDLSLSQRPAPSSGMVQTPQSDQRKVIALARQGLDAGAIAKRLQKPLGEVELILNLQRLSSD